MRILCGSEGFEYNKKKSGFNLSFTFLLEPFHSGQIKSQFPRELGGGVFRHVVVVPIPKICKRTLEDPG